MCVLYIILVNRLKCRAPSVTKFCILCEHCCYKSFLQGAIKLYNQHCSQQTQTLFISNNIPAVIGTFWISPPLLLNSVFLYTHLYAYASGTLFFKSTLSAADFNLSMISLIILQYYYSFVVHFSLICSHLSLFFSSVLPPCDSAYSH